jgi:hypothetical protein
MRVGGLERNRAVGGALCVSPCLLTCASCQPNPLKTDEMYCCTKVLRGGRVSALPGERDGASEQDGIISTRS